MEIVRIEDESVIYRFEAERIAGPVTTRTPGRPRWMEASIWRKKDGTYVFTQASYSTVWHLPGGASHVRRPQAVPAGELPDGAAYCGELPHRDGLAQCPAAIPARALLDEVVTELPQHRVWACPDSQSVVRRMTVARNRGDGASSAAVSGPMRALLIQAAENDPAFRSGVKTIVEM